MPTTHRATLFSEKTKIETETEVQILFWSLNLQFINFCLFEFQSNYNIYLYHPFLFPFTVSLISFISEEATIRNFFELWLSIDHSELGLGFYKKRWVAPRRMKVRAFLPPCLPAYPCSATLCTDLSMGTSLIQLKASTFNLISIAHVSYYAYPCVYTHILG